jgi:SpoVK/Ycf46/Vps4 family AAA+-type ATPase
MATANSISNLPPELLRKGRLDEIFFVDLPTAEDRRRIFEIHIAKRKRDPRSIELDRLSELAEGFSGAEIEQAIISSLFDAFAKGSDLSTELLAQSIRETVPLSKTMHESLAGIRTWASGRARPAAKAAIAAVAPGDVPGEDHPNSDATNENASGARQGRRIEM